MKKGLFLILIDDDEDDRELFSAAVKEIRPEARCDVFSSAHTALKFLEDSTVLPDFLFLDLNMPLMNGKQCLNRIKNNSRLKAIPVVIYSTSMQENDVIETKVLGAKSFIQKPALFGEICRVIDVFLNE
jgi:DNA-binding response OmpR family regulator